jgi:membrane protease YdiL (CAAX protease family)
MIIKNTLIDFLNFLKRPTDKQLNLKFKQKFQVLLILLLLEILFTFLLFVPVFQIIDKHENIKQPKIDYSETLLYTFILLVVIIPIVEELFFRYILRYKSFNLKLINKLIWNKIFPYLVYFFAICFGIIHISNYENKSSLFFLLSPLIVSTQLIGGFVITFIRVRISFIWGCLYHIIWNFILTILMPIAESQFSKPYEENTPKYNITIIEKPFFKEDENQIIKIDMDLLTLPAE